MLQVIQTGYVGAAPELRYTANSTAVANVRVCTTDRWTDDDTGEIKERATWLRWEIWGKSAENFARMVKKGSKVLLEGTILNHKYEKEGEPVRYENRHKIHAWELMDRREKEGGHDAGHSEPEQHTDSSHPAFADIPLADMAPGDIPPGFDDPNPEANPAPTARKNSRKKQD